MNPTPPPGEREALAAEVKRRIDAAIAAAVDADCGGGTLARISNARDARLRAFAAIDRLAAAPSQPDPQDSPITEICRDCRNVGWCASAKQCFAQRVAKGDALAAQPAAGEAR
jgi:hypothetical protein